MSEPKPTAEAVADGDNHVYGELVVPELQQELDQALRPLVPEAKRAEAIGIVQRVVAEHYQGPLPHPRHFQAFEDTHTGAAGKILQMAVDEQRHRHWWEKASLLGGIGAQILGVVGGLLALVGMVGAGVYLVLQGFPWPGSILFGTSLAAIVTAFLKHTGAVSKTEKETSAPPPLKKKQRRR